MQEGQMGRGGPRDGGGAWEAMNRGEWQPNLQGLNAPSPEAMERAYREGVRDLQQLRQEFRSGEGGAENQQLLKDVDALLREMQGLDPRRFAGNPELVERLRTAVLPNLEQLELQLRRKLEEQSGGQVRSSGRDRVPAGYGDAVAEYFRRLSRGK
jgi:hypothetical protein